MKHLAITALCCAMLTACEQPNLAEYTPVVDPSQNNMKRFQQDLIQCRGIAVTVKNNYIKQANQQLGNDILVGAVAGAVAGSVVGAGTPYQGDLARNTAIAGAASGAAASGMQQNMIRYGPNRIIDRCMADRGYKILNDIGFGVN
jgi:outer membrane lipoprotein SlyB